MVFDERNWEKKNYIALGKSVLRFRTALVIWWVRNSLVRSGGAVPIEPRTGGCLVSAATFMLGWLAPKRSCLRLRFVVVENARLSVLQKIRGRNLLRLTPLR